jgi:NADP-dependent aldehyde dehydrogenase
MFNDSTIDEINEAMEKAWQAFLVYRKFSLKQRAGFMRAIAKELAQLDVELLQTAHEETHLPEARLKTKKPERFFN